MWIALRHFSFRGLAYGSSNSFETVASGIQSQRAALPSASLPEPFQRTFVHITDQKCLPRVQASTEVSRHGIAHHAKG